MPKRAPRLVERAAPQPHHRDCERAAFGRAAVRVSCHRNQKKGPCMSFAENLVYLRQHYGVTQEGLAEQLGVSRQTVSKWEAGTNYPEMDKLLALVRPVPREHGRPHARRREHRERRRHRALRPPHEPLRRIHRRRRHVHPRGRGRRRHRGGAAASRQPAGGLAPVVRGGGRDRARHGRPHATTSSSAATPPSSRATTSARWSAPAAASPFWWRAAWGSSCWT